MSCAEAKRHGGKNGFLLNEAEQVAWSEKSVQIQDVICLYKLTTDQKVAVDLRASKSNILIHPALRCSVSQLDKMIFCGRAEVVDGQLQILGRNELGRLWMCLREDVLLVT